MTMTNKPEVSFMWNGMESAPHHSIKRFVVGCLFALLGYELAILMYVLSFPSIYDLWWVVFLGNWARIFLPYVPKVLKEFSFVDVIIPLVMICNVAVLVISFKKVLLTIFLIELMVWQFLGLSWLMHWK